MNVVEDHQRLKNICFMLEEDLHKAYQRNELLQSLVLDLREKTTRLLRAFARACEDNG